MGGCNKVEWRMMKEGRKETTNAGNCWMWHFEIIPGPGTPRVLVVYAHGPPIRKIRGLMISDRSASSLQPMYL